MEQCLRNSLRNLLVQEGHNINVMKVNDGV